MVDRRDYSPAVYELTMLLLGFAIPGGSMTDVHNGTSSSCRALGDSLPPDLIFLPLSVSGSPTGVPIRCTWGTCWVLIYACT